MYEHLAKLAEEIGARIHSECPDKQEDCSDTTGEEIAEEIRAKDLQWTTTPPTVEGWYWIKTKYSFVGVVHFSKLENSPIGYYDTPGMSGARGMEDFTHWLGPLPEPEPPTE